MFYLLDAKVSFNQFEPFEKEGGLLPSFLVKYALEKNDFLLFDGFVSRRKLGDYTFYILDNKQFFISLGDLYLRFDDCYESVVIYNVGHNILTLNHDIIYLLMQGYMYRLVDCGNMMIHSAAIIHQNSGILFCGMSGAGKSTQANLWKKYLNAEVLNYDKPCIINDNKQFFVHGSPWSGKEGVYKNKYSNIRAIVYVIQSKEIKVEKLTTTQAYANLYLHNYVFPITSEIEEKYSNIIQSISENVPVYNLYCDISENSVQILFEELYPGLIYHKIKEECEMQYKIKNSFVMKKIADEYIVSKVGAESVDFSAVVVFNETGAFLWEQMNSFIGLSELSKKLAEKYSLEYTEAESDCESFINKMKENGFIDIRE